MADILVIEDDNALRSLLITILVDAGYTVREAANGKEGLESAQMNPPQLVITDLVMPEKEGIETIIELRHNFPGTGIIAISGADQGSTYLRLAAKLGAQSTLAKPFRREALLRAVESCLLSREQPVEKSAPSNINGPSETQPLAQSFRFVVLDDDENNRFLHRRALGKAFPSCHVIECNSADEALQQCCNARVDAVLTDNHLGGSDGASFVRALREKLVRCPVIMVTGSSDPAVMKRAYAAGADRVFYPGAGDFLQYLRTSLALTLPEQRGT
jgi:CheY-like chemotaxis protein